ncbi:Zinc finger CCCH domain-containing protein 7 [Hibiscus syriacus]|uniref:Zinc finger CCCH domain-containing protein 7 n=1 Tax=Hibiscus syriacus TaxID=106335 RepID=A0A6A3BJ72_HIBSY|nr:Zinc finger CCCH domain-containing protein 7 [Hibiscus syriacus]
MLLLRKRNTVYTRSTNGFSIRKSKVLSVGGSSLKWSKSIEKNSRKANEEATLAVAAADRKKREQNGRIFGRTNIPHWLSALQNGFFEAFPSENNRLLSIYLMVNFSLKLKLYDASSCSDSQHSENSAKKSLVPRRLVIGNDEYVRIGNGNQLIRDPKKRTRVLESKKVRWSLHTARLRLVKKRKKYGKLGVFRFDGALVVFNLDIRCAWKRGSLGVFAWKVGYLGVFNAISCMEISASSVLCMGLDVRNHGFCREKAQKSRVEQGLHVCIWGSCTSACGGHAIVGFLGVFFTFRSSESLRGRSISSKITKHSLRMTNNESFVLDLSTVRCQINVL